MINKFILFSIIIFLNSCKKPIITKYDNSYIIGNWKNDRLKNTESYQYFVPDSIILPFERYRQHIVFKENNVFEESVLSPDDAHYGIFGTWKWVDEKTISATTTDIKRNTFFPEDKGKGPIIYNYKIKIVAIETNKLLLQIVQE